MIKSKKGERWQIITLKDDKGPTVMRFNSALWNVAPIPKQIYQVGIASPLVAPLENGMPTNYENEELFKLEELIMKKMDKLFGKNTYSFMGIVVGQNVKEFLFYVTNRNLAIQAFKQVQKEVKNREVQLQIKEDPEWLLFKQITPLPSGQFYEVPTS